MQGERAAPGERGELQPFEAAQHRTELVEHSEQRLIAGGAYGNRVELVVRGKRGFGVPGFQGGGEVPVRPAHGRQVPGRE